MTAEAKEHAIGNSDYIKTEMQFEQVRIVAAFARFRLKNYLIHTLPSPKLRPSPEPHPPIEFDKFDARFFMRSEDGEKLLAALGPNALRQLIEEQLIQLTRTAVVKGFAYSRTEGVPGSQSKLRQHVFDRTIESPLTFCQTVVAGDIRPNDVQYFYFRTLCEQYRITYGDRVGAAFYRLGHRLNNLLCGDAKSTLEIGRLGVKFADLQTYLNAVENLRMVNAFLECCFSTHLFEMFYSEALNETLLRQRGNADAEYLFGSIFSVPTASPGLNQLFGGNGPLMTIGNMQEDLNGMPGRVLLVSGRFGTGKTVLALLLASEVARKGGVAWYFSTEQSVAEVLFTLRTITGEPSEKVRIITDVSVALRYIQHERGPQQGVLIVLNMINVNGDQLWGGLALAAALGKPKFTQSSLRLAVVDSINAIPVGNVKSNDSSKVESDAGDETVHQTPGPNGKDETIRQSLFSGLERCTDNGMNLLLLEEHSGAQVDSDYSDVRNVADCVIELTVDSLSNPSSHGYARRNIEILKSRFQRDQRGRHTFSILPPIGFLVMPSIPAVKARVGARRLETGRRKGLFGLPELDKIMQIDVIAAGEVNVIRGDPGTFKSAISAAFLNEVGKENASDERGPQTGLLVSMKRGSRNLARILKSVTNHDSKELPSHLRVCQLPSAFVTPAEILWLIERELRTAVDEGRPVRRVVLDDIGAWSSFSPFVRDESSFGPTLLDFFARHALLLLATVSSTVHPGEHQLHDFIVENATRLIQLERLVHGGRQRALLRVVETPNMNHMRDAFELRLDANEKLRIDSRPSLFELSHNNQHSVTGIQLYLQSESVQQAKYNERIEKQLRSTLTSDVTTLVPENISGVGNLTALGLSAINKLQIMQVDGYRLQRRFGDGSFPRLYNLNSFGAFEGPKKNFSLYLDRLQGRTTPDRMRVVAVPYYDNLSFLVGDSEKLRSEGMSFENITWEEIADKSQPSPKSCNSLANLFFDFPQSCDENLNCLFLEILFDKVRTADSAFTGNVKDFSELYDLLVNETGKSAAILFQRIASPAYHFHSNYDRMKDRLSTKPQPGPERFYVAANATIWRHWFTTFNQMMVYGGVVEEGNLIAVSNAEQTPFVLRSLPGEWTTSGEWYLCIPEHSAVPGAGLAVIEMLQNDSADRERYDLGVGLPVRKSAYEGAVDSEENPVCPSVSQLTLDFFHKLQVEPMVRRDQLPGYGTLSPFLANWLRRLLHTSYGQESSNTLNRVLRQMLGRTKDILDNARETATKFD